MSDLTDTICRAVTMRDICTKYGYEPNRAGYISCPIHNEKTPSLKVYPGDGGWHCFGCGAGGSVIDFVMQVFGINFRQALVRICNDFGIQRTSDAPGDISELQRRRAREQRERISWQRDYNRRCAEYRRLRQALTDKRPKPGDERLDPEYAEALHTLPYLDHWFEHNRYKRGGTN